MELNILHISCTNWAHFEKKVKHISLFFYNPDVINNESILCTGTRLYTLFANTVIVPVTAGVLGIFQNFHENA